MKGCNEKAAVPVTQLATALVCSAKPCRGRLGSLAQLPSLQIFCCCQGNKLSGLKKKKSHSKDVFSNAGLNLKLACVLDIQPVPVKHSQHITLRVFSLMCLEWK